MRLVPSHTIACSFILNHKMNPLFTNAPVKSCFECDFLFVYLEDTDLIVVATLRLSRWPESHYMSFDFIYNNPKALRFAPLGWPT